ncbi:hypothetical protein COX73_00685 [bacterium (Candidatus Gribaldobacteria) CG_4_10_14_0_2_um_filter_36_18]|uniref:Prepilin-type N-terminal cleavage/methylation domain-containing protein n=1 Tax=bacterium (Candidatus Gribaldobacteria) CG_4_10_14_0_2_um_filter_36_18 TaxID=2014264 RepID=A0A2M7VKX9_9BACT|nr:MAG: hypothetical protein COX73_00685 [bacterium (Candidatus Gribaldobacteria) CG_4_10_14_0_2_um_filter_36_18]
MRIPKLKIKNERGVTLTELLVSISILIILTLISTSVIFKFQKRTHLTDNVGEVINTLEIARNKTLASEGSSQWGVFFNTSTIPHQYTLFKGSDYGSRTTSSDEIYKLSKGVEFSEIDLGGKEEVVFERLVGNTYQFGTVSLRLEDVPSQSRTIYIEGSGQIGMSTSSPSDANRLKDSRHLHFQYSREIATSTEKLVLTFGGGITKEIVIADNLENGQIYWEGEIEVESNLQKLKIHTHRLNSPDTLFCIHRDQRYNNKALNIDIDGDPDYPVLTPTLLRYEADGLTSKGNSFYVSDPICQ